MLNLQELTPSQIEVYGDICSHVMNRKRTTDENKYLIIDASAGVGKTFTVNKAISYLKMLGYNFLVTAFTGRACMHLSMSGIPAKTCHSILFKPVLDENDNLVCFTRRDDKEIKEECGDFVVIDEASMIPLEFHQIFHDVGVPIIYLGDSYQLPPVDALNPDFNVMETVDGWRTYLTVNMRFSDESGIFWLANRLKESNSIPRHSSYSDLRVITKRKLWKEEFHAENYFDGILCGTNKVRRRLNDLVRRARGYFGESPEIPTIGEQIVCLRNDVVGGHKINNGEVYIVKQVMPDKSEGVSRFYLQCKDNPKHSLWVRVTDECWATEYSDRKENGNTDDTLQMFGFGYAMSVHKAQGSSIEDVLFVDEDVSYFLDPQRFRYTAVTRASKSLTVAMI